MEKENGKWRMYNTEEKAEGRALVRGRCEGAHIEEEACEREGIGQTGTSALDPMEQRTRERVQTSKGSYAVGRTQEEGSEEGT